MAKRNAAKSGGSFTRTNSMAEAFEGAHVVYPKSWAPFAAMERRTDLYGKGDLEGIKALEKELLVQNASHKAWECTEKLMATTHEGSALYMHCLPGRYHRRELRPRRGGSERLRPLPRSHVQRGKLQALHHCGYDPVGKVKNAADNLGNLLQTAAPRVC